MDLRNVFTTLATHKESRILVAEQGKELIGALVCTFYLDMDWEGEGKVAKLQAIIVDEHERRHGIGGKLYKHFLTYAKRHNARAITARVNQRNKEAMAFYQKFAFTKAETAELIIEIVQNPNT